MLQTFNKLEKLKHKKLIEQLFAEGKSIAKFPLRLVYLPYEHLGDKPLQTGFSVPKKKIKNAVDRNRIKRQMREAYRLRKAEIYSEIPQKHIVMFIYLDDKLPQSKSLHLKMEQLLQSFVKTIN